MDIIDTVHSKIIPTLWLEREDGFSDRRVLICASVRNGSRNTDLSGEQRREILSCTPIERSMNWRECLQHREQCAQM